MAEAAINLVDQLFDGIRKHVLATVPSDGRLVLEALSVPDLLIEYRTWRWRFIEPKRRKVHLSRELQAIQRHRAAIAALASKFETGEDVTIHLSNRVHKPFENLRAHAFQHRTDRDSLLADWGIHHLHLSSTRRADDVLFAAVVDDAAYFVDVRRHPKHDNWAAQAIFATMVRNWPDAELAIEIRDVRAASLTSDEERLAGRDAGLMGFVEVHGRLFAPRGLGQTTAGTPVMATQEVNVLMHMLDRLRADPNTLISAAAAEVAPDEVLTDAIWMPAIQLVRPGFEEYCGFATNLLGGMSFMLRIGRLC